MSFTTVRLVFQKDSQNPGKGVFVYVVCYSYRTDGKPEDLSVVPSTHLMSGTLTRICSPPLGRQTQDVPAARWPDHLAWGAVQNPIPKRSRMESSWVRHLTLTLCLCMHTLSHTRTHTYTQMCTQVPFFQGVVIISSLTHIKTYNIWT